MTESEISLASMSTDDPEFPAVREALLQQYRQLFLKYAPRGSMTRKRSAEPWEVAASGYTAVILVHTETIAGAFSKCWYASGFALTRPVLEALLKQSWLATCNGADGWEHKVSRRQQVTQGVAEAELACNLQRRRRLGAQGQPAPAGDAKGTEGDVRKLRRRRRVGRLVEGTVASPKRLRTRRSGAVDSESRHACASLPGHLVQDDDVNCDASHAHHLGAVLGASGRERARAGGHG